MNYLKISVGILLLAGIALASANVHLQRRESARLLRGNVSDLIGDVSRGAYVAIVSGCYACHTDTVNDGAPLAGGSALTTPFGTFYPPNITSHKIAGIGSWSLENFQHAMLLGRSPSGQHYYPAFPYTSYTTMQPQDLVDLKVWLDTVKPVAQPAPAHKLVWPVSIRSVLSGWKLLYFDTERNINSSNRGDYLVNGIAHCAECHASRNLLGGQTDLSLTGNRHGPEGKSVPGISQTDLSDWSTGDIEFFLELGMLPDGDFTGGHMANVVEYSTRLMSIDDRTSIARHLLSNRNSGATQ
ncbi:MAG: cytochrome C [Granulosicoccus sp.]